MPAPPGRRRMTARSAVVAIVVAQCFGTALWFSPSGAAAGLSAWLDAGPAQFGWLVAATQIGFIVGTLVSALTGLADRFAPERIFIVASLLGAGLNLGWTLLAPNLALVWIARFAVGVCLAGIYPMGMKMIVKRARARSAQALSWLVGMLALGTAMPQLLAALGTDLPWQAIMWGSSGLAVVGAVLIASIGGKSGLAEAAAESPSSPQSARGEGAGPGRGSALRRLFSDRGYRAAVFGYVGHMWELYAFWAVVPTLTLTALSARVDATGVAATSFAIIAVGTLGCILGGVVSRRAGSARVAATALAGSGLMCLLYPLLPGIPALLVVVLLLWGLFVVADSPQFSELASTFAPDDLTGTGLTAMNSIGFGVSVISIVLLQGVLTVVGEPALWLLLPGPVLGLLAMRPLLRRARTHAT